MKKIGLYIHIPFCKSKCYYCDFVSFAKKEEFYIQYVDCIKKELIKYSNENKIMYNHKLEELYEIDTIYIGGGTPSIIDKSLIEDIIKCVKKNFYINNNAEITIEINPGTADLEKLETYKSIGINRLSIGLQARQDNLLKQIGRIHTYEQFKSVYMLARKIGFNNINIDLMIGLPSQTLQDVKHSIKSILNLKPEHISVYSLIVEENTLISKKIQSKELVLPSDEEERKMYWYVKRHLEKHNYNHYEISNFAKPGFESKHNLDCWNQKEYIGIGLAASSFLDNNRYSNISDLDKYIYNVQNNIQSKNLVLEETLNIESKMKEYMILGLRKISGVNINSFKDVFNTNPIVKFCNELNKLSKDGLIIVDKNDIKLTNKGLDLANVVWGEFA